MISAFMRLPCKDSERGSVKEKGEAPGPNGHQDNRLHGRRSSWWLGGEARVLLFRRDELLEVGKIVLPDARAVGDKAR